MSVASEPALGLVETRGLIGAIEAADAMLKGAPVRLVRAELTQAALMTVQVVGKVAAVQAAVEAGEHAARRVGQVVSSHVLPNPAAAVRADLELHRQATEATPPGPATMTVQQLRARARATAGFPLSGRAIARAKKSELMTLLDKHG